MTAGEQPRVSATHVLRELVALSVHGVELRAYVDKFLYSDGILAVFEVDLARTAGVGTGEVIYFDKPSEALLNALATARAMKEDFLLQAVDGACDGESGGVMGTSSTIPRLAGIRSRMRVLGFAAYWTNPAKENSESEPRAVGPDRCAGPQVDTLSTSELSHHFRIERDSPENAQNPGSSSLD
jgi:hypothetical protein